MTVTANEEELIPYAGGHVAPCYLLYNENKMRRDLGKMKQKVKTLAKKYECRRFVFDFSTEEIL